jgi:hypothetical protein
MNAGGQMRHNWRIFQKTDKKWYWHCEDGGPHESPEGFDTMTECLADASAHGYASHGCTDTVLDINPVDAQR